MLIVDDQPSVGVSLSFFLGSAGHRGLTAESGRAAIALAQTECFDGAIIDVHMPVMNGFDARLRLQAGAHGRPRAKDMVPDGGIYE